MEFRNLQEKFEKFCLVTFIFKTFFQFSGDKENVPKKSNIMFVRGESQSQSVLEAEKEPTVNPDAIDLDSDDDSDEVRNFNQWTQKKPIFNYYYS